MLPMPRRQSPTGRAGAATSGAGRAGKLPHCGWMPDGVPESAEWTRLAPQREAERVKLEEKRRAMAERHEASAE